MARYKPEMYRADVLRPPPIRVRPFDSISATYLLHCLPGRMGDKAAAFDTLTPLLNFDEKFCRSVNRFPSIRRNVL